MKQAISLKYSSRQLLSNVSFYSGYYLLSEYLKLNRGVRILCFHGVSDNPTNRYAVSASDFSRQMRFLAENYKIIPVGQIPELLQSGQEIAPNLVAVTIDDGYRDFFDYAFPVLQQYAIPATVFLPTGLIDSNSKYEKKLPQSEFLTWKQIRKMHQAGIEFGSHSVSHASLTSLTRQETQYELEYSKARLEAELSMSAKGFAYPYGTFRDTDPKIGELIANIGYSWALTSVSGVNREGTNIFALRRTVILREDGLAGFKRALKGALDGWIVMQKCGYYLERMRAIRNLFRADR